MIRTFVEKEKLFSVKQGDFGASILEQTLHCREEDGERLLKSEGEKVVEQTVGVFVVATATVK